MIDEVSFFHNGRIIKTIDFIDFDLRLKFPVENEILNKIDLYYTKNFIYENNLYIAVTPKMVTYKTNVLINSSELANDYADYICIKVGGTTFDFCMKVETKYTELGKEFHKVKDNLNSIGIEDYQIIDLLEMYILIERE